MAPGNTTCLRWPLTAQVLGVALTGRGAVTRTCNFFKSRFFIVLRLLLGLPASPSLNRGLTQWQQMEGPSHAGYHDSPASGRFAIDDQIPI